MRPREGVEAILREAELSAPLDEQLRTKVVAMHCSGHEGRRPSQVRQVERRVRCDECLHAVVVAALTSYPQRRETACVAQIDVRSCGSQQLDAALLTVKGRRPNGRASLDSVDPINDVQRQAGVDLSGDRVPDAVGGGEVEQGAPARSAVGGVQVKWATSRA